MTDFMKLLAIIALAALVVVLFIGIPLAIIWSLNTLFSLGIEYTVWTWLATLLLGAVVSRGGRKA
jgi:hypothetical protein